MKIYRLLFLFNLFCSSFLFGQHVKLSGYIKDATSGEVLISATIFSISQQDGVVSNAHGFFSIQLEKGRQTLEIAYLGYTTKVLNLNLERDSFLNIELDAGTLLSEVEVSANQTTRTQIGSINLPVAAIKSLPSLGGVQDVLKTMQLLPGVKFGNEGTT